MRHLLLGLFTVLTLQTSFSQAKPVLKIGLVADPQYADNPLAGNRYYRESLWKLKEAITTFNENQVDFVQNLGDIIDIGWMSYDSILPLYQDLDPDIENHHLLGNHDFAIPPSRMTGLLERLSMPDYYYSYEEEGWHFIVLDATDYAYYSKPLHNHDIKRLNAYMYSTIGKSNNHSYNSAIGKKQQKWLKQELERARLSQNNVIIFSHSPLRPFYTAENLWNNEEILDIIETSSNVVAYINGHNHAGNYELKNGIHYITIFGMVDTRISSYGILEIYEDTLVLKGFGNQKSFHLKWNQ
jgi:manganese-dependent ADP-ribose/CDP-alcohol diphosphatase